MNDESGLIDLKALMAVAQSREQDRTTPAPVVQHIAVYPLGAPPEQVAPPAPTPDPEVAAPGRNSRWTRALPVVLGALAVAGAVAVVLLARGPTEGGPRTGAAGVSGEVTNGSAESLRVGGASPGESATPRDPASTQVGAVPAETSPRKSGAVPAEEPRPVTQKSQVLPKKAEPKKVEPKVEPKKVEPKKQAPPPDPCKGDLMCAMKRSTERH